MLAVLVLVLAPQEPPKPGPARYAEMDHGPFFTGTIDSGFPSKKSLVLKGLVLRLDRESGAAACFDLELLKVASAWTGGFLSFPAGRDGIEGQPAAAGAVQFGAPPDRLGWASAAGDFRDPRALPYGPLPEGHARWRGLALHGERAILRYDAAGAEVREVLGYETSFFTRTLELGPSPREARLLLAEGESARRVERMLVLDRGAVVTAAALLSGPEGALLETRDARAELVLPARKETARVKLAFWTGPPEGLEAFARAAKASPPPEDLAALERGGGGPRWPEAVELEGKLGEGDGVYVVDTLPVPFQNPWKSYMRLSAFDFFPNGRSAAVATFDGDVWIVSGIDAELKRVRWKRFATGLFQPLGIRIVDETMFVTCRDQLTRLRDRDGDGEADLYECVNNDVQIGPNFHEFGMDLETDREGWFYFGKSASWPPKVVTPHEGTILRVSPDGKRFEVFATGVRNPNGLAFSPSGELWITDNEGHWTPTCWLGPARKGQYLMTLLTAHREQAEEEYTKPLCWIPRDIDNSTGDLVWAPAEGWGPLGGSLLVLSYGTCSLFRVLRDGEQGSLVRLPLEFESGLIRARFNPGDGQLYVAGLRA